MVYRLSMIRVLVSMFVLCGLFGLLCGLLSLPGCGRQAEPSLVLIIMDTTRADRLGFAGHAAASTSSLDSLAVAGVSFATTITATPVTGPAIATILSGVLPPVHGMRDNARFTLNRDLPLLAETFRSAGYETGAVVGAVPLLSRFGYARGFAHYDDSFAADPYRIYNQAFSAKLERLASSERRAGPVTDRALTWLNDVEPGRSFFLLVHYFDPHGPYDPPPPYNQRFTDAYDGEVAYMDDQIGRLLAGLRERFGDSDMRVVVVGDHGEGLGDHDEATHGFFVYDTTLEVPLVFSGDRAQPGLVVAGAVRTLDIAPTLCAWLGVPAPDSFDGQDLTPALTGGALPAACDTAYVETFLTQLRHDWSPLQSVRTPAWIWILAPRRELYDLAADPGENENLVDRRSQIAAALEVWMKDSLASAARRTRTLGASLTAADPEIARQLDALGYVSSNKSLSVKPDYSLPDPKDGNREWNRQMQRKQLLANARVLDRQGEVRGALTRLAEAAGIEPLTRADAAFQGHLLGKLGRHEEALASYRRALGTEEEPRGRVAVHLQIARTLVELGRLPEAAAHCDTLRSDPAASPAMQASLAELEKEHPALR